MTSAPAPGTGHRTRMAVAAPGGPKKLKMTLLGEAAVGKTSLVMRMVHGTFNAKQESTIGAMFTTDTIETESGDLKLEIWDTAGQERFHCLAPMYYRNAQAALIVYDITSMDSFHKAKVWVEELHKQGDPNIMIALAGNKADLEADRQVPTQVAEDYAAGSSLLFRETSAKTSFNVQEMFRDIAHKIGHKSDHRQPLPAPEPDPPSTCCSLS